MLTLLTTQDSTNQTIGASTLLKVLLEAELLVLELSPIVAAVVLLRRHVSQRRLTFTSAILLILGALLLWVSATILVASA